ncbi:52 kDa repressor of the inhibitor of the protein kinase [Elysia marginata]|uniref:52 kDa repressor of the inhibitor of the protein kinase n=1 Tax=Elysia marginata TaxID=1093978 RepID=A0AAV4H7Q2_9GAST|nr:52 kDa repressor of the inhibitor of the protein kinase [Elysia marginata]
MAAEGVALDSENAVIFEELDLGSSMDIGTSKSKRKKSQWCSAINCTNGRYECPGLSFFRFPRDDERCKKWVINCRRQDLLNKSPRNLYTSNFVCAVHFEDTQFTEPHKKNRLKPLKAVPTLFNIPNPPPKIANRRPGPEERVENSALPIPTPTSEPVSDSPSPGSPPSMEQQRMLKLKKKIDSQRKRIKRLQSSPSVAFKQKRGIGYHQVSLSQVPFKGYSRFFCTQLDMSVKKKKKDGMHITKARHCQYIMPHPTLIFFSAKFFTCPPSPL